MLPVSSLKNSILTQIRSLDPSTRNIGNLKNRAKKAQTEVMGKIAPAKAVWSMHQAKVIHHMCFTLKEAWRSVKILTEDLKISRTAPTVMQLRFLATTDAENASVMGPHLVSIYQKHCLRIWEVLNNINQRNMMNNLDIPISWDKLKKAITKITNGKAPGLNSVPPDTFKALNITNLATIHVLFLAY